MKRLFTTAEVTAVEGGFAVALEGKALRTPSKISLTVPSRALAEALAEEWLAQGEKIKPDTLVLTRLANTALDIVPRRRADIVADIVKYAGTDLLCYRADHPPALVERQQRVWQPLLDWAAVRFEAPLTVTTGVVPTPQPPESIEAFARAVDGYDAMALAALSLATGVCGSLVVALALVEGRVDAEEAFAAAELDESFEIELWGEDAEQTVRRAAVKDDIMLVGRFVGLLRG